MNYSITRCLAMASLAAGLLYLPDGALAQQTDRKIDTTKVYQLDEIIISAGRYEESPETVGRNVTVITREEIRNSIHSNLADLLADRQSVHMVGNRQTPGSLQQGFIRNANSNHSLVLVDGVRLSDPSTVNNNVDLSEISLLGVERIEIVRGSHSTLYGSSAIGGVINIITSGKGSEGLLAEIETGHGAFGANTYSTSNKVHLNYATPGGFYINAGAFQKFANGLDATIDTVSNPSAFNPQDRDDFEKLDLTGKLGYRNSGWDLYASYRYEDQNIEIDQGAFNDDSNAETDFSRNLFAYGVGYEVAEGILLNYDGAYSDLNRDFVNDSSLVDNQGNFDGSFMETNAEGSLLENKLTAKMKRGAVTSSFGLESSVQKMSFRTFVFSRSIFGVFESTTDLDSLNLNETINSAFIHTEIEGDAISETLDFASLTLGGRILDHNEFGTHATFEINPEVRLTPQSLLYGSITTGFNAPSLFQLNSPELSPGEQFAIGNPGLQPEESISYELGWKQTIGSNTQFILNLFKTDVEDLIEFVFLWDGSTPVNDLGPADFLGDTYINISSQEINGLEIVLDMQPDSDRNWSLGGNLTLTSSTVTFSEDDIDKSHTGGNHVQIFESGEFVNGEKELDGLTRRPRVSARIHAGYHPTPDLTLGISSRFTGSRDDIFFRNDLGPFGALDRSEMEAYNLTDLNIRYTFGSNLSVMAKIENVFDSDYMEINGFKTRGRSFFGKIQYRFGTM